MPEVRPLLAMVESVTLDDLPIQSPPPWALPPSPATGRVGSPSALEPAPPVALLPVMDDALIVTAWANIPPPRTELPGIFAVLRVSADGGVAGNGALIEGKRANAGC